MAEAVIEEGQDATHSRVVLKNEMMMKDLSFEGFHEFSGKHPSLREATRHLRNTRSQRCWGWMT